MNLYGRWLSRASGEKKYQAHTPAERVTYAVLAELKDAGVLQAFLGEGEETASKAIDSLYERIVYALNSS